MTDTLRQTTSDLDREIGHRIREFRKIRGYSQERLAEVLGITFQQVQKYEKGTNRIATATLVLICKELKINPMDVIGVYFGNVEYETGLFEAVVDENRELRANLAKIRSITGKASRDFGLDGSTHPLETGHVDAMPRRSWPTGAAEIITQ